MIFASRQLLLVRNQTEIEVPVHIYAPYEGDRCWVCRFVIGWPEAPRDLEVNAFDSVQALYLAMQRIALELYVNPHHKSGNLRWGKKGDGYGFPMPVSGYDDLVGFDRESQVP